MKAGDKVWSHLENHVGMSATVEERGENVAGKPTWYILRPDGQRVIRYEEDLVEVADAQGKE